MSTIYATHRHYKGGTYCLLGFGSMEATQEQVAIYQSLRDGLIRVRPATEFTGEVEVDGAMVPRFALLRGVAGRARA